MDSVVHLRKERHFPYSVRKIWGINYFSHVQSADTLSVGRQGLPSDYPFYRASPVTRAANRDQLLDRSNGRLQEETW